MQTIDIVKSVDVSRSVRARQLESMFDVPAQEKITQKWRGSIDIDSDDWNIGLIIGPSGCGKSTIAKKLFEKNYDIALDWNEKSVIDDFRDTLSIDEITQACSSVGFNTIPSWLKPHNVLSTGEKFRVDMARRILELESPIVIDEFTSVVDRQVAKIGCHAIQKFIRKYGKRFVAVSCHYDIVDWLQPDWIFEPATMTQKPRGLLQRPKIEVEIKRVHHEIWKLFAPYHYMNSDHNDAAMCYVLFINDVPVCFNSILHYPHKNVKNLKRLHRVVTLPDYQGIGFAHVLMGTLGAAHKAIGNRLRAYPAHPPFIMNFTKNIDWKMIESSRFRTSTFRSKNKIKAPALSFRKRFTGSIFEYFGQPMDDIDVAKKLLNVA